MNSDVMPSIVRMEPEVLKSLLTEIKETVATTFDMPAPGKTSFTRIDMWKIRRNAKSATRMLRRIN
ncbi:MAG: hypothetical protein ABWZ25_03030 [Chitinophagaceae bacterium]